MLKDRLQKHTQVFTSPISALKLLHSKYHFIELLEKWQLPFPKTFLATNKTELDEYRRELQTYVLKPEYSRFADKVVIDRNGSLLKENIDVEVDTSKNGWCNPVLKERIFVRIAL